MKSFFRTALLTICATVILLTLMQGAALSAQAPGQANNAPAQRTYKSMEEVRKATEQGDATGQLILGSMYYKGLGVPQDYAEAARWYRKAAEQGDEAAQYMLGDMYYKGLGVPQDYAEAARWYRKAAEQGNAPAQFFLGLMYNVGTGVQQDSVQALMWFNLACPRSSDELKPICIKKRDSVAARLTTEQVEEALRLAQVWKPKSSEAFGESLAQGTPTPPPASALHREFFALYDASGQQTGSIWLYKNASGQNTLMHYSNASGQSTSESIGDVRKAAEQGDASGQFKLGYMYYQGQGVTQNYAEAARWLRKAAEQGDASAQISLSVIYDQGQGVPQDHAEAVRWYSKATKQSQAGVPIVPIHP